MCVGIFGNLGYAIFCTPHTNSGVHKMVMYTRIAEVFGLRKLKTEDCSKFSIPRSRVKHDCARAFEIPFEANTGQVIMFNL